MENLTVSTQLVSQVANASSIDASAAVSSPDASTDPTLGGLFGTLLAQQIALVLAQDGQQGELPIDITKKPGPKLNHNRKTEEYPAHIVKRFELDQRYIPGKRWFTRFEYYKDKF